MITKSDWTRTAAPVVVYSKQNEHSRCFTIRGMFYLVPTTHSFSSNTSSHHTYLFLRYKPILKMDMLVGGLQASFCCVKGVCGSGSTVWISISVSQVNKTAVCPSACLNRQTFRTTDNHLTAQKMTDGLNVRNGRSMECKILPSDFTWDAKSDRKMRHTWNHLSKMTEEQELHIVGRQGLWHLKQAEKEVMVKEAYSPCESLRSGQKVRGVKRMHEDQLCVSTYVVATQTTVRRSTTVAYN